ncbi:MAG: phosphonate C-P lyase system protein PhnL [Deltaproteobacteria bacterium]|jgi:alpha-D-ribose 1-methylphosphonate 5-triphosphate synthase subunit PhnL|nr:phosphonate C-P lyase system protein PhnL [Deltaproteobacteria bacterium]
MTTMLIVENFGKTFTLHQQGGVRLTALKNVSLEAHSGECLALTGPSGAGKSTLLRCLYGNYLPGEGRIAVNSRNKMLDLSRAGPREILEMRRETMSHVSQFLRVIPRVAALDSVAEPLLEIGTDPEKAKKAAKSLLTRLRIPERLWSLAPATFSGGERQRVNVARGFIRPWPVMLLDEPTASLDAANRQTVRELILEVKNGGSAVIAIFHDEEMRRLAADREHRLEPPQGAAMEPPQGPSSMEPPQGSPSMGPPRGREGES